MNLYAESSAILTWLLGEKRASAVRRQLRSANIVTTETIQQIRNTTRNVQTMTPRKVRLRCSFHTMSGSARTAKIAMATRNDRR